VANSSKSSARNRLQLEAVVQDVAAEGRDIAPGVGLADARNQVDELGTHIVAA
jgi:hypothetical protein